MRGLRQLGCGYVHIWRGSLREVGNCVTHLSCIVVFRNKIWKHRKGVSE